MNTNETPNGVIIQSNAVIFPASAHPGGGNWYVDVKVIPTKTPVSGIELSFNVRLLSGTNYNATAPLNAGLAIINTGPQLLLLSAASPSTLAGMDRGILNDQARFVIARLGDTNGPNNDSVNPIVQSTLNINNFNFCAPAAGNNYKAVLGTDYLAGPQLFTGSAPANGSPGISIAPGVTNLIAAIGNPVIHANTGLTRTNLTVILNLTNVCNTVGSPGCNTNCLDAGGLPYQVTTTAVTLTEFDNALGGETVLWSDPLTDPADASNWTLVFGSTVLGYSPALPTVMSPYDNSKQSMDQYTAWFGKSVNDPGTQFDPMHDGGVTVPQSQTMAANGWTTALKVSVNKNPGASGQSGINLYPNFVAQGNYALRFDMYLSLYDYGYNNPTIGTPAREYAAFGINHQGNNVNWRLDANPIAPGAGAYPINADGEWCSIGAASGAITPADWDMFISPPWATFNPSLPGGATTNTIPYTTNLYVAAPFTNAIVSAPGPVYSGSTNYFANGGVPNDQTSSPNNAFGGSPQNGILKNPPFVGINSLGGAPDNAWVDVSLELTRQTNLVLKVAQQQIMSSSTLTPIYGTANPLAPFSGKPMLGYLDPNRDVSDYSAFVYYSNLRVVELSPFIPWTNQPMSLIVTQGCILHPEFSSYVRYRSDDQPLVPGQHERDKCRVQAGQRNASQFRFSFCTSSRTHSPQPAGPPLCRWPISKPAPIISRSGAIRPARLPATSR